MTKYTNFCLLSQHVKPNIVAEIFMETIQKLHGISKIILSDKDPIFTVNFWTKLFSCLGTQLAHNSSYHLESNGKIKIVKKCLKGSQYLFAYDKQI